VYGIADTRVVPVAVGGASKLRALAPPLASALGVGAAGKGGAKGGGGGSVSGKAKGAAAHDERRYLRLLALMPLHKDFFFSYSYHLHASLQVRRGAAARARERAIEQRTVHRQQCAPAAGCCTRAGPPVGAAKTGRNRAHALEVCGLRPALIRLPWHAR